MNHPPSYLIKDLRVTAGLTQKEAAKLLFVCRDTWSKWENGHHKMSPALFKFFMNILLEKYPLMGVKLIIAEMILEILNNC